MTRKTPERAVLTISRAEGVWSVEVDGQQFGHSSEKDVARAAASRKAREIQDGGRPCEIRTVGEPIFTAR